MSILLKKFEILEKRIMLGQTSNESNYFEEELLNWRDNHGVKHPLLALNISEHNLKKEQVTIQYKKYPFVDNFEIIKLSDSHLIQKINTIFDNYLYIFNSYKGNLEILSKKEGQNIFISIEKKLAQYSNCKSIGKKLHDSGLNSYHFHTSLEKIKNFYKFSVSIKIGQVANLNTYKIGRNDDYQNQQLAD